MPKITPEEIHELIEAALPFAVDAGMTIEEMSAGGGPAANNRNEPVRNPTVVGAVPQVRVGGVSWLDGGSGQAIAGSIRATATRPPEPGSHSGISMVILMLEYHSARFSISSSLSIFAIMFICSW